MLGVTGGLLFLPKVLALGLALVRERQKFGGGGRLVISAMLEMFLAVLVAPIMMMYHARFRGEHPRADTISNGQPQARAGRLIDVERRVAADRRHRGRRRCLGRSHVICQPDFLPVADADLPWSAAIESFGSLDEQPVARGSDASVGVVPRTV